MQDTFGNEKIKTKIIDKLSVVVTFDQLGPRIKLSLNHVVKLYDDILNLRFIL